MTTLETELDALVEQSGFSGVIGVDRPGEAALSLTYGLADRAHGIPNQVETRFGLASGSKTFTALTVVSMIESGVFELDTPVRRFLGSDLPLIDDQVTIEHLLAHRSGIGDYLDEDAEGYDPDGYLMPVPVQELVTTEQYMAVLDGFPQKFPPDERFSYCNGGYVVLAIVAERAGDTPFPDLVRQRVCEPAGMHATEFLRSDELPGDAALGYIEMDGAWRTNLFHLPVRGTGDGGMYSTLGDIRSFWNAFFAGRIVSPEWVSEMVRPRSTTGSEHHGLGIWLHPSTEAVNLEGADAGVSFRSVHDRRSGTTHITISNTSDGAWPITRFLDERLGT